MKTFAPINKMEAQADGTIKVWGVASSECVDNDGETITAAAMKAALPEYMKWGAVREMHQPIAAGSCLEASVDENSGQTLICAHITDEGSIRKVKAKTLKGFSIGGNATSTDPLNKTIITGLVLNEISLVDKPANPEAAITLWKADKMNARAQQAEVTPVTGEQLGNEIENLVKGDVMSLDELMALVKAAAAKKTKCDHGVMKGEKCEDCEGGIAKSAPMGELIKRYFSEEERHDAATAGQAMPDGSFPIENEEDLKNAIRAHGRAKDPEAAKKHIEQRAKEMGKEDLLPDDWTKVAKSADGAINGNEPGADENKTKGTPVPGGGTGEPAGDDGTQKAAKTNSGQTSVEKTAGNAEIKPVGPGTSGAANAVNPAPPAGVAGATENPQAEVIMLPATKPKIGDLVTIHFGEDEVGGTIANIKELGDGSEVTVQNGDALLAVNSSMLIHNELVGEKSHWKVTVEDNAEFTTAKAAKTSIHAALEKAFKPADSIEKGMWTVGSWADIMQSLCWLMKDIKWEYASEDDSTDDALQRKMAAPVKALGEIMIEYAQDQLKEMFTGVCDPDNIPTFIIELAQKPGELQKFASGGAATVTHVLKKAFGAGTTAQPLDTDAISKAISKAVSAEVTKAVAAEGQRLEKAHAAEVQILKGEIKRLEEMPVAPKGILKGSAMDKDGNLGSGSGQQEIPPVKKADGTTDDAATAIKKSFLQPQSFIRAN